MFIFIFFFFNATATTEIYTLSLHDALPILDHDAKQSIRVTLALFCILLKLLVDDSKNTEQRSEEHTSELQSLRHLVCRLLLEKKKVKSVLPWTAQDR